MTGSTQLHHDANTLRQKVQSKRDEANNAMLKATDFTKAGSFDRAAQESERANRSHQEILEMERTAMGFDHQAAEIDSKAYELEKRENELSAIARAQIERLQQQQKSLRGNS